MRDFTRNSYYLLKQKELDIIELFKFYAIKSKPLRTLRKLRFFAVRKIKK